jgi:hypothetical protein
LNQKYQMNLKCLSYRLSHLYLMNPTIPCS